jgi:hypothetical protein
MAIKFLNTVQVDTDVLYVDAANDRVGIGTTSPQSGFMLDVNGKSVIRGAVYVIDSLINFGTNDFDIATNGLTDIKFRANNSEKMRITSAGNVGIGTTSPDSLLEISSDSVTDFLKLTTTGGGANPIKLIFEKTTSEQGIIEYNRNGDLEIYNTDSDGGVMIDGSASEGADLYVSNTGNVGIGTTSPQEKLDISAGSIRLDDNLSIKWASVDANVGRVRITGNEVNDYLAFVTDNSEKMRLTNTGLGIGTTSPDSKLNIEGPKNTAIITLGNTTAGSSWVVGDRVGGIDFYSADGSGGGIGVKASISYEDATGGTGSSQAMVFRTGGNTSGTNNVERMRLQYNGNVGIGTTSPSANLEVQGTNSNTQAALKVTDSGDSFFEVVPDNNTTFKIGDLDAVGDEAMIVGTFSDITFSKGGTTTMILDSNNRVGIGTTSPSEKLHFI